MYHFNVRLFCYKLFTLCFFIMCLTYSSDVFAMSIADYSYNKVYDALPEKYQDEEFVYESADDICLIEFADYNNNPYRTSVKKTSGENNYLYCVDRNNSIEFTDNYRITYELFDEELRTRLAMAFYYGPVKWNDKASSEFTTGNSIVDYYMTQLVIHALIYDYGDKQANMGIDFDKVVFKDNTGNLKKKTTAFYQFCCEAAIKYENGYFQAVDFQFNELQDNNMYVDGEYFTSPTITCDIKDQTADVISFERNMNGKFPYVDELNIKASSSAYNSDLQLSFSSDLLDLVEPGNYNINILENVTFDRKKAAIWQCAEIDYVDITQELGGLTGDTFYDADDIDLDILIGKLYLYKSDSVTGEEISDAQFQVLQYNSSTKKYEHYCDMTYDAKMKRFESSNLYLSINNKDGQFKVIETSPGKNYQLDWNGHYFQVTPDVYMHELYVENEPILGKLTIQKTGEQWSYEDEILLKNKQISLPYVKFELYAKDDIYIKDRVFYSKNQKIVDMITNQEGKITVEDLPMGNYYIKESSTLDGYVLDQRISEFSITRDQNRQYNHVSLALQNQLKTSQIHIYKYYDADDDEKSIKKIPLKGAKFGLYLSKDLCGVNGDIIIKKDTCVATGLTDENGNLIFDGLPYTEYYIKELDAPEDFVLNDGIISLHLDDFYYDEKSGCYITKQEVLNKIQRFQLSVEKTGEAFTGYYSMNCEYGEYYAYEIGKNHLKDVSFTLYNDSHEILSTQVTNQEGKASFTNLVPGTYYLTETSTPAQYKRIELDKDITLKMDSREYNEFSPPIITEEIFNELCQCSINLSKYGENTVVNKGSLEYDYIPLEGVVYGIYQNFDYTFSDSIQPLSKNSCVGYIVTNQDGEGTFQGKLPCGNYYVKELRTKEGYVLDTKPYYFDIKPNDNQTIEPILNDGKPFINELSKAAVQIIKTDSNTGKSLKGVEFTLYNANKEPIGVYKTNKKGKILVKNLPYGKYYFVETKSKDGYYSSNNKYYFELSSDETVVLNITNSPILQLGMDDSYEKVLLLTSIFSFVFFVGVFLSFYFVRRNHGKE